MAQKTYAARPVNDVSEFNSQVDIIIPFHGQYDMVIRLLDSIFRLTRSNFYEIYLVDDNSPNADFIQNIQQNAIKNADRLRQRNVVNTFRCESRKGFAGACKIGWEHSESPYVCFINSDCEIVDSSWLRNMGESLLELKEQGVRMVAPMTDNPVNGDPAQKGDKFSRSEEDVILGNDSHLSMYCFLCHRELFNRCGGFLKEYPYGYYEDEEFAARMRKNGFKQAVCRSSWVHHDGEATIREVWRENPEIRRIMEEENRQRCIEDIKKLRSTTPPLKTAGLPY
jgi:GT2 family glycosyltransferase